jgi:hypothetical protein
VSQIVHPHTPSAAAAGRRSRRRPHPRIPLTALKIALLRQYGLPCAAIAKLIKCGVPRVVALTERHRIVPLAGGSPTAADLRALLDLYVAKSGQRDGRGFEPMFEMAQRYVTALLMLQRELQISLAAAAEPPEAPRAPASRGTARPRRFQGPQSADRRAPLSDGTSRAPALQGPFPADHEPVSRRLGDRPLPSASYYNAQK